MSGSSGMSWVLFRPHPPTRWLLLLCRTGAASSTRSPATGTDLSDPIPEPVAEELDRFRILGNAAERMYTERPAAEGIVANRPAPHRHGPNRHPADGDAGGDGPAAQGEQHGDRHPPQGDEAQGTPANRHAAQGTPANG